MRLDDYRESSNVEQDSGGGGGGGGFPLGAILGLGGGRMGLGTIVILIILALVFGINPLSLLGGGAPQTAQVSSANAGQVCETSASYRFSCKVLATTEDTWSRIFQQQGQRYQPPVLHFFNQRGMSGCGAAQAAMGPFYCPTDHKVYLDTSFFDELRQRFGAPGDFAQAYVIAHEVGHHIQALQGIDAQVRQAQARGSEKEANAIQVRMELQADCYAGVWGAANKNLLDPGDLDEAVRAAQAIGDDTLQKQAQGYAVPDSFTHGTSAERMAWLKRGYETGDPAQCDTFNAASLDI
jgi:uncharacterized protein